MISFKKKQNFNVGLYSDIYRPTSFKLGMMIEITMFSMLISVSMTLPFIQGCSCIKYQTFGVHFLAN